MFVTCCQLPSFFIFSHKTQQAPGPLYCLSRLVQQSSWRAGLLQAMLVLCERKFFFRRGFAPSRPATSPKFRSALGQLLWTPWDAGRQLGDQASQALQLQKQHNWQLTFRFFNGNVANSERLEHFCSGPECCADEASSLSKARPGMKLTVKFTRSHILNMFETHIISHTDQNRIWFIEPRCFEAKVLLSNSFFGGGMDLFHPQRWHMCLPALMDWCALVLCHKVGLQAIELSGNLDHQDMSLFGQALGQLFGFV